VEEDGGKPPVARLLSVGAKGAGRMAHVTGVDRALDEAVEEAILRALQSPAIGRALERAMASHAETVGLSSTELAEVVKRVLESEAAEQAWVEVLASDEIQTLVERIAGAPEIRAAIAAQTTGLITDMGVRLTHVTEKLDDAMERVTRRRDPDSETDQAGLATRVVAAAIDLGLLFVAFSLSSSVIASVFSFTLGGKLSLPVAIALGVLAFVIGGLIIATFWALAGQTPGMRFLSIRVIQDGAQRHIPFKVAIRRVLGLLVSVLCLGLGYLAILRDPSRHAWHDRWTNTEVIYDPVARAPHARVEGLSKGADTEKAGQHER
jgi:uncharacterized RDD family membrane protein YckC